jgi:hypothetical protein
MPAHADFQGVARADHAVMDSRFRGNDENKLAQSLTLTTLV